MTTQLIQKAQGEQPFDSDDLNLLQTMLAMQEAEEPGSKPEVVAESKDAPMVTTKPKSAGYINLRRNSDGKLVLISKNQLAERLKQKLPNGQPAWLAPTAPWKGRPKVPKLLCLLHPEHPDRARMDELNLDVCEKRGKLQNEAALRRHMAHKHKDAWDVVQRDEERRKQETRDDRQLRVLEALAGKVGVTPAPVPHPAASGVRFGPPTTLECEVCHAEVFGKHIGGAKSALRAHMKKEHP